MKRSGDGAPGLTKREEWIISKFGFLKTVTHHFINVMTIQFAIIFAFIFAFILIMILLFVFAGEGRHTTAQRRT